MENAWHSQQTIVHGCILKAHTIRCNALMDNLCKEHVLLLMDAGSALLCASQRVKESATPRSQWAELQFMPSASLRH
jgi:hypothetical protein